MKRYEQSEKGKLARLRTMEKHRKSKKYLKSQKKYAQSEKGKIARMKSYNKRKRNLDSIILFENPFDNSIKVHYHHINNKFVVPIPAELHNCYSKYHTFNDNEHMDYLIEQFYPDFDRYDINNC